MSSASMETHFAPAARTGPSELARRIDLLANNPVIDTLMNAVGGLVAILDDNRQILAVNRAFIDVLGCGDGARLLGLRPGEALGCVHAADMPGGCGTSAHCATCGAVLAIVTAMAQSAPVERSCVAEVKRDGDVVDLVLKVRACPIDLGGERITVLVMQDITEEQRLTAMEQSFYHDVSNVLQALTVASDLLEEDLDAGERRMLGQRIGRLVEQLDRDLKLQRALHAGDLDFIEVPLEDVPVETVLGEVRRVFLHHPAAAGKTIAVRSPQDGAAVRTDLWLLVRVLTNLVINALEATAPGDKVEVDAVDADGSVVFSVRSPSAIPGPVQRRIFQRNFTTKEGRGHGLGTWSARLFAKKLLGGDVSFVSNDASGTVFRVTMPA